MFARRKPIALGIALAAMIGLAACSTADSPASRSTSGGTLTIGALQSPTSFAADSATWANQSQVMQAVYDTLLHADAKNEPTPWLATSWSYNDDKTVLTLKLRSDVTFSDGTAFDADVAAQNLMRFKKGTAPDAGHLADLQSAKAVDPTTLQLTLTQPNPALLTYLSQAPGLQESPQAFGSKTEATVPVGSGPYVLDTKTTVPGSSYVFTRNPTYFAKNSVHFDELVVNIYTTSQAALNAVKGGQIEASPILDNTTIPQIKAAGFLTKTQALDWDGIAIFDRGGKQTPELGDVRVRQAINYAIDRKALLKAVGGGYGEVTSSVFPTYSPGYEESLDSYYTYDPAKAKQLLAAAGALSFTLNMPRAAGFGDAANDLIKQYLGAVGIQVTFTTISLSNAVADILTPKYSASYFRLQEDPTVYQEANFLFTENATFNPYHYSDPKVAAWVKELQTGSTTEATAASKALNRYTVEQAWNAPWYRNDNVFAYSPKLSVRLQPGNSYPYLYNIQPQG